MKTLIATFLLVTTVLLAGCGGGLTTLSFDNTGVPSFNPALSGSNSGTNKLSCLNDVSCVPVEIASSMAVDVNYLSQARDISEANLAPVTPSGNGASLYGFLAWLVTYVENVSAEIPLAPNPASGYPCSNGGTFTLQNIGDTLNVNIEVKADACVFGSDNAAISGTLTLNNFFAGAPTTQANIAIANLYIVFSSSESAWFTTPSGPVTFRLFSSSFPTPSLSAILEFSGASAALRIAKIAQPDPSGSSPSTSTQHTFGRQPGSSQPAQIVVTTTLNGEYEFSATDNMRVVTEDFVNDTVASRGFYTYMASQPTPAPLHWDSGAAFPSRGHLTVTGDENTSVTISPQTDDTVILDMVVVEGAKAFNMIPSCDNVPITWANLPDVTMLKSNCMGGNQGQTNTSSNSNTSQSNNTSGAIP